LVLPLPLSQFSALGPIDSQEAQTMSTTTKKTFGRAPYVRVKVKIDRGYITIRGSIRRPACRVPLADVETVTVETTGMMNRKALIQLVGRGTILGQVAVVGMGAGSKSYRAADWIRSERALATPTG
jgi:hypothetical protein